MENVCGKNGQVRASKRSKKKLVFGTVIASIETGGGNYVVGGGSWHDPNGPCDDGDVLVIQRSSFRGSWTMTVPPSAVADLALALKRFGLFYDDPASSRDALFGRLGNVDSE